MASQYAQLHGPGLRGRYASWRPGRALPSLHHPSGLSLPWPAELQPAGFSHQPSSMCPGSAHIHHKVLPPVHLGPPASTHPRPAPHPASASPAASPGHEPWTDRQPRPAHQPAVRLRQAGQLPPSPTTSSGIPASCSGSGSYGGADRRHSLAQLLQSGDHRSLPRACSGNRRTFT